MIGRVYLHVRVSPDAMPIDRDEAISYVGRQMGKVLDAVGIPRTRYDVLIHWDDYGMTATYELLGVSDKDYALIEGAEVE